MRPAGLCTRPTQYLNMRHLTARMGYANLLQSCGHDGRSFRLRHDGAQLCRRQAAYRCAETAACVFLRAWWKDSRLRIDDAFELGVAEAVSSSIPDSGAIAPPFPRITQDVAGEKVDLLLDTGLRLILPSASLMYRSAHGVRDPYGSLSALTTAFSAKACRPSWTARSMAPPVAISSRRSA